MLDEYFFSAVVEMTFWVRSNYHIISFLGLIIIIITSLAAPV
jgi:hypothetical protein